MNDKDVMRFLNKTMPDSNTDCILWTACKDKVKNKEYGKFYLNGKRERAHRVSWMIHRGKIPKGMHVLHRCDNPPCVNPDHLFLGSNQDNVDDKMSKGRLATKHGESNVNSKLTWNDVRTIRNEHDKQRKTIQEVANEYDVSYQLISRVIRKEIWKEGDANS